MVWILDILLPHAFAHGTNMHPEIKKEMLDICACVYFNAYANGKHMEVHGIGEWKNNFALLSW